jgi:hypothetical protein
MKKNSNYLEESYFIKTYNFLGKQNFFSILAKQVKNHSKFAGENSNGRVLLF